MPIRELRAADFDQECAKCGAVVTVPVSAIVAGVSRDGQTNPNVIAMPVCASCGAAEFLLRSPVGEEHPSQGSFGHKHKLLVDTLHARLVKGGRLVQGLTAENAPIREPSAAVMERWFKDGLKLPPPPKTDGGAESASAPSSSLASRSSRRPAWTSSTSTTRASIASAAGTARASPSPSS